MTVKIPFHPLSARRRNVVSGADSLQRYQAEYCLNSIGPQHHTVFQIDQSSLRPSNEKGSHWSIAWSDLMMTMFILFLSLFVYQAAHKDFLVSDEKELIAGDTEKAIETDEDSKAAFPFMVIKPSAPFITAGTIKKIESITLQEIDLDSTFSPVEVEKTLAELAQDIPEVVSPMAAPEKPTERLASIQSIQPNDAVIQPMPLGMQADAEASVNTLYSESQVTLDTFNLNDFAAIDLEPNKAVRIILTGDLLFETGAAALSREAVYSLEKVASVIHETPYQIHIEGHTDNIPISSGSYSNNWELSFARANAVAVFLIEDMGMDPEQFVISGYSSYRPVAPNTSIANRAANRRVEIVIAQTPYKIQDTTIASSL